MKPILFITLPFTSHYHALFPLANHLHKQGRDIFFTGTNKHRQLIENEGHQFTSIKYQVEYSIRTVKSFVGLILKSAIDKDFKRERFREWYVGVLFVRELCSKYQFSEVYIDEHLSIYYAYLIDCGAKITIINTKLSTQKRKGVPPLNSSYIVKNVWYNNMICSMLWSIKRVGWEFQKKIGKIAFLGVDDLFFEKRWLKKRGWTHHLTLDKWNSLLYSRLRGTPTDILAHQSIDFKFRDLPKNERFLSLKMQRIEQLPDWYIDLCKMIEEKRISNDFRLVYCCFGTLTLNDSKIRTFLKELVIAIQSFPNWLLVISDRHFDFNQKNVIIVKELPQLNFLERCDLMITHGGLTTIKECIQTYTPMIVYPIKGDQLGNSARIVANELGIRGVLGKDNSKDIYLKLKCIDLKRDHFISNLKSIKL